MITGTRTPPALLTPRSGTILRGFLGRLVLLGLGFLGGVAYVGRTPAPAPRPPEAPKPADAPVPTPTASPSGSSAAAGPARLDPEDVLKKLAACVRGLTRERAALAEEITEGQIRYKLLRARGYAADSPECQALVATQRRLTDALKRLDSEIEEARRLETDLQRVIADQPARPEPAPADETLLQRARVCVQRHKLEVGDEPIPYGGEPDVVMGSKTPARTPAEAKGTAKGFIHTPPEGDATDRTP